MKAKRKKNEIHILMFNVHKASSRSAGPHSEAEKKSEMHSSPRTARRDFPPHRRGVDGECAVTFGVPGIKCIARIEDDGPQRVVRLQLLLAAARRRAHPHVHVHINGQLNITSFVLSTVSIGRFLIFPRSPRRERNVGVRPLHLWHWHASNSKTVCCLLSFSFLV